jgi:uncharacterized protein YifN (PemK superfamily)
MVKVRPVVVIARNRCNNQLVTVVPLSTTKPHAMEDHHHELSTNPLPDKAAVSCWAKCDMVVTVAIHRLDRYKYRTPAGLRQYVVPVIGDSDFLAIQIAVVSALRLGGDGT